MDPSIVYEVKSVEVKEISFRLDGVFLPPDDHPHLPICFVEVQFQKDPLPSLPNTPYLAGSVTELAGNAPEFAENLPKLAGNPPELAENPPELAGNPPELAGNPPELAGKPPEFAGNPPELAKPVTKSSAFGMYSQPFPHP